MGKAPVPQETEWKQKAAQVQVIWMNMRYLLTELELRELRIPVCSRLDPHRLRRLAPERLALPCALRELREILVLFPLVLRPSQETDYVNRISVIIRE